MAKKKTTSSTISESLRGIIRASGMTAYALGKKAAVDPAVIARFVSGERDLRLETVDKLCAALDCELNQKTVDGGSR
jgi:DNA-binding Xre family transcriptional regulator